MRSIDRIFKIIGLAASFLHIHHVFQIIILVFIGVLEFDNYTYAQTLAGTSAIGNHTTNNSSFLTVTGASVTLDVSGVNNILVVATFQAEMTSPGGDVREASYRIADNSNEDNINSGIIRRSLSSPAGTDYRLGSLVYIFNVSSISGNRTYCLQHSFSITSRFLTTDATIVAINLESNGEHLKNTVSSISTPVTLSDSWDAVTGSETNVISTSVTGGFYISASIESETTSYNTASVGEWKLQYKKGVAGTWIDLNSPIERSMSSQNNKGIVNLVASLPNETSADDYYFRIAHIRTSATSTIQTTSANLVAVSLGVSSGIFPVISASATNVTTTNSSLSNAVTVTLNPDNNTDLFLHSQYRIEANAETNSPTYDLYVDNSMLDGADQKGYISSSSDIGSGSSVGLVINLVKGTTYNVSLRHASASGNTLTSDVSLNGFELTVNGNLLPIDLLYFKATYLLNSGVAIKWATESEVNNNYFTVERSQDGIDFEVMITVTGAGNSNTLLLYEITDDSPLMGISYYRLKQTDYDGRFKYFNIETVNLVVNNPIGEVTVSTNPFTYSVTINYVLDKTEDVKITIHSINGHEIYSTLHRSFKGTNRVTIDQLSDLTKGIYFITLIYAGQKTTAKLFKI